MTSSSAIGSQAVSVAESLSVVLVEDDEGDAFLVQELLRDQAIHVDHYRSLAEAAPVLQVLGAGDGEGTACVLLDLHLPDASGLEALEQVRTHAPGAAVLVLTGLDDRAGALRAVAAGAQDYLLKGSVDGEGLARSIRYAVERRRSEDAARRLATAELRAAENARLARGLVPRPLIRDPRLALSSVYRPGGGNDLLGGDFFDAVELPDSRLRAVIGDVCGHGPDEAALGVSLRIAWRAMTLAGAAFEDVLPAVESVLFAERPSDEIFATALHLEIAPARDQVLLQLAGHPPPLVLGPVPTPLSAPASPALGVLEGLTFSVASAPLQPPWRMLLYTDGILEAPARGGRLGEQRFAELAGHTMRADGTRHLEELLETVEAGAGSGIADDVALVRIDCSA